MAAEVKTLQDFEEIKENIRTAPARVIRALHNVIYEEEGDRSNRKRLRQFTGSDFEVGSDEFNDKLAFVSENLNQADLIAVCNLLKLNYDGTTEELADRICRALANLDTFQSNENSDDEVSDDDEDQEQRNSENESVTRQVLPTRQHQPFSLSFKDVEDSIRTFDGTSSYGVETWVEDFEDMSRLCGWSEIQKLIFAKKSLRGLAKLFIQGEKN
jgi:hypothetical protein